MIEKLSLEGHVEVRLMYSLFPNLRLDALTRREGQSGFSKISGDIGSSET